NDFRLGLEGGDCLTSRRCLRRSDETRRTIMEQAELLQKAERYLPGACLGMMTLPPELRMVLVRGQGSKVYDAAGKEYLDYMLGSGPLLLGHCRPEVVESA